MMRTILVLLFMGLLVDCNGDSNATEAKSVATAGAVDENPPTTSAGTLFTREITKQPCELLTPGAVAEVAGVDPSILKQRVIVGICSYSWDGGKASLGHLRTRKTVEFARSSFENSYSNQTGEEVAENLGVIDDEIEKQKAGGKTDVDPARAKMVTGAMSNLLAGGMQFEGIAGLGDAARFETTRSENQIAGETFVSYANALNVLVRNLKFTVSFNLKGEPRLYRDENVALAEAVLKNLPD